MSDDKELLKLAAKAAGLNVKAEQVDADDLFTWLIVGEKHTKQRTPWNPLTDDGDALRLAVKLQMDIQQDEHQVYVWFWIDHSDDDCITEDPGDDRFAATRRAIVHAAVEIGRAMS